MSGSSCGSSDISVTHIELRVHDPVKATRLLGLQTREPLAQNPGVKGRSYGERLVELRRIGESRSVGVAQAADILPTTKSAARRACELLRELSLDVSQFDRRRLSVELRSLSPSTRRLTRASGHTPMGALESWRSSTAPGVDQQAKQRLEVALVAEQHQSVGHRYQDGEPIG